MWNIETEMVGWVQGVLRQSRSMARGNTVADTIIKMILGIETLAVTALRPAVFSVLIHYFGEDKV